MADMRAEKILSRWESLKGERGTFESHWQDVADLVSPTRDFTVKRHAGEKRRKRIYDGTAPNQADRLSGSVMGLLTNPAQFWFSLRLAGEDPMNQEPEVRAWLRDSTMKLFSIINNPSTRFYPAIHEVYYDLCTFGTGFMSMSRSSRGIHFKSWSCSECILDENADGEVDTVYCAFELTPRQAVEKFGFDAVPEAVKKAFKDGKNTDRCTYLHVIMPRGDFDPNRKDAINKPVASMVIAVKDKEIISEGGFDEFPYVAPRWNKMSMERYGRSPAMTVLPDINMVNAMSKTIIVAAQKAADPPLQVPDDGFLSTLQTQPGSINYYRTGTQERVEPLPMNQRFDVSLEIIESYRDNIRKAFFDDLFSLPQIDRMTATEAAIRQREQAFVFAPLLTRLYSELLGPLVTRLWKFASTRTDFFSQPPEAMAGRALELTYVSPLAQSQRASEAGAFTQLLQLIAPIAQSDPIILQTIDSGAMVRWGADMFNLPEQILRSEEELEEIRQQQQQQQQMIAGTQALAQGGRGARDLAEAAAVGAQ